MTKEPVAPRSATGVLELLPPFPIVLVTTRANVITINQFHYFTFSPLRVGVAVAHSRHTHGLLAEEREFVVNIPDASLVEAVKTCGRLSGRDHDKFRAAGLEREEPAAVGAACVRQCGANVECVIEREVDFEDRTWFVGRVVAARRRPGHSGARALMCSRREYAVTGEVVAAR